MTTYNALLLTVLGELAEERENGFDAPLLSTRKDICKSIFEVKFNGTFIHGHLRTTDRYLSPKIPIVINLFTAGTSLQRNIKLTPLVSVMVCQRCKRKFILLKKVTYLIKTRFDKNFREIICLVHFNPSTFEGLNWKAVCFTRLWNSDSPPV